jgi:hypothetical protein
MGTATRLGRTLHVALCEVERGVFYATYPDCESAAVADEVATYHIGASAADAKRRIELSANALGYDTVIWTETVMVPPFASPAKTVPHESAATFVADHRA